MIKAVDLFCGIGGLTYGLEKAGIDVVLGVDFDQCCKYAYEKNNNAIFLHRDVFELPSKELMRYYKDAKIKILAGCAPCQPFSNHQKNKDRRSNHKDWGLLYEFLRLIKEIEPEIVSVENVPSICKEIVFSDFCIGLKKMGYHITYKTDNALNYGMAQRRNRLLLLASSKAPISFVDDREDSKTVYDVIGSLETLDAGSSSKKDRYHVCSNLSPINLERIKASKPGGTWNDWNEELLPDCFRKKSGKTYSSVYGRMDYYSVSPTLTTQFNAYGTGRFGHPTQNRAISIREGALLQSFPVNYDFVPEDEEVQISTLARQIGNAVPPRLGLHIGRNRNRLFGYIEFTIASI